MNDASAAPSAPGLLWFGNSLVSIPVSQTGGSDGLSVIGMHAPHGDSPPMHVHATQDEVFVVLAGRLRVKVGGTEIDLGTGMTTLAPKGIPHSYRVESPEGAQFLAITKGEDFETMIRKASRPADSATVPTPCAPTPVALAALTAACAESGITFVGPPLG